MIFFLHFTKTSKLKFRLSKFRMIWNQLYFNNQLPEKYFYINQQIIKVDLLKIFFYKTGIQHLLIKFHSEIQKPSSMTQFDKENTIFKEALNYAKSNASSLLLGLGLAVAGLAMTYKMLFRNVNSDLKRIHQLRSLIAKSQANSLQALQTLKIQKRVMTQYGNEKQGDDDFLELNMLFIVMSRLKLKDKSNQQQLRNPFLPPFQQGIYISELEPSHRLLYNKFNIYSNHLLIITKEFQAQSHEVTQGDFKQAILVIKALTGVMFFNSGKNAGSSQPHKHLQVFPQEAHDLPIIKQIINFVRSMAKGYDFQKQQIIEFPGFNFVHGLIILQSEASLSCSKKMMHKAYNKIIESTVEKIKGSAYNILATEQFIMIVVRRKEKAFDQIGINSVGFMGSLMFKDDQGLNKYLSLKIRPHQILEDITYPKNYLQISEQTNKQQAPQAVKQ